MITVTTLYKRRLKFLNIEFNYGEAIDLKVTPTRIDYQTQLEPSHWQNSIPVATMLPMGCLLNTSDWIHGQKLSINLINHVSVLWRPQFPNLSTKRYLNSAFSVFDAYCNKLKVKAYAWHYLNLRNAILLRRIRWFKWNKTPQLAQIWSNM